MANVGTGFGLFGVVQPMAPSVSPVVVPGMTLASPDELIRGMDPLVLSALATNTSPQSAAFACVDSFVDAPARDASVSPLLTMGRRSVGQKANDFSFQTAIDRYYAGVAKHLLAGVEPNVAAALSGLEVWMGAKKVPAAKRTEYRKQLPQILTTPGKKIPVDADLEQYRQNFKNLSSRDPLQFYEAAFNAALAMFRGAPNLFEEREMTHLFIRGLFAHVEYLIEHRYAAGFAGDLLKFGESFYNTLAYDHENDAIHAYYLAKLKYLESAGSLAEFRELVKTLIQSNWRDGPEMLMFADLRALIKMSISSEDMSKAKALAKRFYARRTSAGNAQAAFIYRTVARLLGSDEIGEAIKLLDGKSVDDVYKAAVVVAGQSGNGSS